MSSNSKSGPLVVPPVLSASIPPSVLPLPPAPAPPAAGAPPPVPPAASARTDSVAPPPIPSSGSPTSFFGIPSLFGSPNPAVANESSPSTIVGTPTIIGTPTDSIDPEFPVVSSQPIGPVIQSKVTKENIIDLITRAKQYIVSLFNQEQVEGATEEVEQGIEEAVEEEPESAEVEEVLSEKKGAFAIDSKNIRLADIYIEDFTQSLSGMTPPQPVPLPPAVPKK